MVAATSPRLDEAFDALGNVHRRRLLMGLRRRRHARLEAATRDAAVGGGRNRDRLKVELFHIHLPKLADAGFVEWNRHRGSVARGPRFDEIEPLLRFLDENAGELSAGGRD
ncbi:hypothetical protein DEQ92_15190 [Haloferax sp. Atlit-6N]|uniref:DUF7344 domain-containing protein n=1 Tax=unclassified Haloferax TaxID=2625095 RepID=UPI000E263EB8|nr:hypothetical protein C5C07_14315 [Haloferax sp. Atlit-4N]REA02234.1 hypothetical protein DEQ92_15190 [Haloferax sp. Atlit-6N]